MLLPLTVLLAVLLVAVTAKWLLLRKEVDGIAMTIRRIQGKQTNERVSVSTQDKAVHALAVAVNSLYDDAWGERAGHIRAMDEIHRSMAGISHDLRTPLTSIIGYVKLLRDGSNTPEQREHYMSIVQGKADSLKNMINGLFELTRLEAGTYQFMMERTDAGEILTEELAGYYGTFDAVDSQPMIELCDYPQWIIADRSALSRVFSNLLSNMAKHGKGDIRIASSLINGEVMLTFSNRAHDLDEEDVERLFQRFYTADRMRTGEDTGIGLSIVKEFVEQTNGRIAVRLLDDILTFTLSWKSV